jgi:hypothetical protein
VVDRCGKEVRYIIDFYQGPAPTNGTQQTSVYLDVRPTMTLSGAWDRFRMKYYEYFRTDKLKQPLPPSSSSSSSSSTKT